MQYKLVRILAQDGFSRFASTACPIKETISKQTIRSNCPIRSTTDECKGIAYMSGS